HGNASNDVYMVGGNSEVLHWNGAVLSAQPLGFPQDFTSVRALGPDDVWAVGRTGQVGKGLLVHRTGGAWARVDPAWGGNDAWSLVTRADGTLMAAAGDNNLYELRPGG